MVQRMSAETTANTVSNVNNHGGTEVSVSSSDESEDNQDSDNDNDQI